MCFLQREMVHKQPLGSHHNPAALDSDIHTHLPQDQVSSWCIQAINEREYGILEVFTPVTHLHLMYFLVWLSEHLHYQGSWDAHQSAHLDLFSIM